MAPMLCDVAVHELAAGHRQLLQSSRNEAGHQSASMSHLDCRLRLKQSERYVLLGKNGVGKTTLLRSIASKELPDWPHSLNIFLVEQEGTLNQSLTPLEAVFSADAGRLALEKEAERLEAAIEVAASSGEFAEELMEQLNEVWDEIGDEADTQREHRAESILHNLGFSKEMMHKPLCTLSGGWQMRASLAAGLFMRPDLLLLDEPTNQLDLDAITWLQHYLGHDYKGTVLCVSHDRTFINEVATELISFADHRLEYFTGNLDDLDREAAKKACNMERQVAALERQRDHVQKSVMQLEESVARSEDNRRSNKENTKYAVMQGSGKASGSSQIAQRRKKLERMGLEKTLEGKRYKAQDQEGPRIGSANNNDGGWVDGKMTAAPILSRGDPALQFGFEAEEPMELREDEYLLELHDVGYRAPGCEEAVLVNINLNIAENCRIACIGKNGAGKSTLLKMLAGKLGPTQGDVVPHGGLQIAYFGQHDAEVLRRPDTPLDYLQSSFPQVKEQVLQDILEEFGISGQPVSQSMQSLSGGQRVRVAFAHLSIQRPHLLVLDEPTNHLDIYAIEAMIEALQKFNGGVIFVTHNQSLLQNVAKQVIIVKDSGVHVAHLTNQVVKVKNTTIASDNTVLL